MNDNIMLIGYENLERISKLLELQISEEVNIMHSISDIYFTLTDNYVSGNTNTLEQIGEQSFLNMNTNKKNHDSNIFLINRRIEKVKAILAETKAIDDNTRNGRIV